MRHVFLPLLAAILACSPASKLPVPSFDGGPGDAGGTPDGGGPDGGNPDAGGQDAGTADAGTPPVVNVTLSGSCPALTPCGGDPTGEWWYTAGCMADPFPGITQYCSTATYSNPSVTLQGKVVFDGVHVTRSGSAEAKADVHVPSACNAYGCATIAAGIESNGCSNATCTDGANGSCDCAVDCVGQIAESNTYTVSGTTLNVAASPARTYDFCVNGGTLKYHETDSTPAEPGWFTLTKH